MKDKLKSGLKDIAIPLGFLFATAVAFLFLLPYSALKTKIETGYNSMPANQRAGKRISIDSMSSWWRLGMKAEGVTLSSGTSTVSKTTLDVVRVRPQLLPLLVFRQSLGLSVDAFGGNISGSASTSGIDLHFEQVDASAVGALKDAVCGIPLTGTVNGDVTIDMPNGALDKASGTVRLAVSDLAMGDGKTAGKCEGPTPRTIPILPKISIGTLNLEADVKDGKLKWTKLAASGSDISIKGDGTITFKPKADDMAFDTMLSFQFSEALATRNEQTKALFDPKIGILWMMFPDMQKARKDDGSVQFRLGGTAARTLFTPAGGGAGGGALQMRTRAPAAALQKDDGDDAP